MTSAATAYLPTMASLNQSMAGVEAERSSKEVLGIQYLRGLAALMVVIFHVSLQVKNIAGYPVLTPLQSGVDIFFVISGFVMAFSTKLGLRSTPREFLAKRLVRIIPLYWAATLLIVAVLVVAPQFVQATKLTWPYAIASLFFIAQESPATPGMYGPLVAPGWTLNLEMLFYLCFAFGLATRQTGWRLIGVATAPVFVLCALGMMLHPKGTAGFYTNSIMAEFVYGMLLGVIFMKSGRDFKPNAAVLAFVTAAAFAILVAPFQDSLTARWIRFGAPAAILVAGALWARLPRWWLPHLLGDASYSIYISHFFVLSALAQVFKKLHLASHLGVLGLYPCALILCPIAGVLCWRYVEVPLTSLARRLILPRASIAASARRAARLTV